MSKRTFYNDENVLYLCCAIHVRLLKILNVARVAEELSLCVIVIEFK